MSQLSNHLLPPSRLTKNGSQARPLAPHGPQDHAAASAAETRVRQLVELPDPIPEREATEPLASRILPDADDRCAYIYDLPSRSIIGGAAALARLSGYDPAHILARPDAWSSLVTSEDDLDRWRQAAEELFAGTEDIASQRLRIICKGSREQHIQHDWRILDRDSRGAAVSIIGLVQVITSRVETAQALANEAALTSLSRMLVEEWAEGIYLLDSSFRILYANQGALKLGGYEHHDLYRRSLEEIITCEPGRKSLRQAPRGGQKVTTRAIHLGSAGATTPVEITARRVAGERILVTSRDISAQIAFEEAGRRQTAYYKGLFVNNPSGVAVFDSAFRIKESNPALRKMVGFTERQLHQMHLSELLDPESRGRIEEWRGIADASGRASSDCEVILRRRDGRHLYAHAAVTVLAEELETAFRGLVILTDISARRQAEIDLARQFELNDKLIRESAAMIGMVDREGRVIKVNPAVERVSGFSARELIGKSMWECGLLDQEEVPRAQARMQKLVEGAPRVSALSRTRTKSGELRIIQVQNTATRAPGGQIENFIITAVDLTEQHRLQHHLMEAVEQEQARIGHDLHDGVGQILTGIGAMVGALQGRLTGADHDDAAHIHDLVQQAIHQVRQLSHNMSPAAVQNRDLAASLILLADMVRTSLRRQCDCEVDSEVKVTDPTKSTHLFRIAQEAINNAIRHGNPSRITLMLKRHGPAHALLEIANDGASFDCRPGTEGIGLRVMQYRASMIHADLTITCPDEGGVRVTCRFPLPPAKKSPQPKTQRHTP